MVELITVDKGVMAALIQAIKQGSIRGIRLLIEGKHIKDDNFQKEAGTTALIEACKFGDKKTGVKMARILLENNGKIESRDFLGRNALHWACLKAYKEMIELFVKSSEMLDFNAIDFNGNSVMFHTVSSGNCQFIDYICRIYVKNGGSVDTKNNEGISAVDLALKLGHKSCAAVVNRATGLTRTLSSTGYEDINCCMFSHLSRTVSDNRGSMQDAGNKGKARGKSFETLRENRRIEKAIGFNPDRLRKTKFISLSSGDLSIKEQAKLPALGGQFSLVTMNGRERSQTDPSQKKDRKMDKIARKHGIFKAEILPSAEETRLPNTYKDLLVDFNSIYSVENTSSYRRGFSKPKEKTKIVTFSESIGHDKEDDGKSDDKTTKNKLSRKVSRMNETKFNSTFISKGKERRKSKKSRDEL